MSRVAVTGAAGAVGQRVCALAVADPSVTEVVAIDRRSLRPESERVRAVRARLADADLVALFEGVDTVCHLAATDPLADADVDHDLRTTVRVLDAAAAAGVGQVIVRSSALVYGAWPDNPIPITESAPVQPNGDCSWAVIRSQIEGRVAGFVSAHPDVGVTVLRPTTTVSDTGADELGRALAATRRVSPASADTPVQFVHVDDVAAAVDAVRRRRASGVYNVAPDGFIATERVHALVGGGLRVRVPFWFARRLHRVGWRYQLAPTPPGFVSYVTYPWVVANDRLRALGWEPEHTNAEAFVAGHDAAPWAQISPQRRQELALGVAALGLVAGVGVGVALLRRRTRRRTR